MHCLKGAIPCAARMLGRFKAVYTQASDTHFQVAQRWSGIMAFGKTKYPIVKAFSPRVFGAFRMGGMGVALGSRTAQQVVELIHVAQR